MKFTTLTVLTLLLSSSLASASPCNPLSSVTVTLVVQDGVNEVANLTKQLNASGFDQVRVYSEIRNRVVFLNGFASKTRISTEKTDSEVVEEIRSSVSSQVSNDTMEITNIVPGEVCS